MTETTAGDHVARLTESMRRMSEEMADSDPSDMAVEAIRAEVQQLQVSLKHLMQVQEVIEQRIVALVNELGKRQELAG